MKNESVRVVCPTTSLNQLDMIATNLDTVLVYDRFAYIYLSGLPTNTVVGTVYTDWLYEFTP